jgi:hypothetical protein
MKLLRRSLLSLFALTGALLLNGCSPDAGTSQKANSQGKESQGESASAGVYQNIRQAKKRLPDEDALHNFALAYTQYALLNGQGPSNVQEIKDSLTPKMAKGFEPDGIYTVNWKIKNPSGSSILAYVKEPDAYGTRLVAKGDGSVVRMSKEEFGQAMRRR